MLTITVPDFEIFNEQTNEFHSIKGATLQLEHSLVSISKWESKWHKYFLDERSSKSNEEILDYIRCMTITQNVRDEVFMGLTVENYKSINEYIANPMTATTINHQNYRGKKNHEVMTSEVIYYYMIALNIPMECQKWHLNRLMMLIQVCSIKNEPPQKMKRGDILRNNAALNAARRKTHKTKG